MSDPGRELPYSPGEQTHDLRSYEPPGPVGARFLAERHPVRWLKGPMGSGKTNLCFFDGLTCAYQMPVCRDGRRRWRGVTVRDNYTNMWKTTIKTWFEWFPKTVGLWSGAENRPAQHVLLFDLPDNTQLEMEMLFLAVEQDRIENVLKGIEFTWGYMNEGDLMAEDVLPYMLGRVLQRRYPPARDLPRGALVTDPETGELMPDYFVGIVGDMNPPDPENWTYDLFEETRPEGHVIYHQPSGLSPQGENRRGVSYQAYKAMAAANAHRPWWVRRNVHGLYGYSREGTPVYEDDYDDDRHVAAARLEPLPGVPLRLGFDQGVKGPAMVVGQMPYSGQLRVLREFRPGRIGPTGFGKQCLNILREEFRLAELGVASATCDPAGLQGSDRENGDLSWLETLERLLGFPVLPAETNEIDARLDGVRQLLRSSVDRQPALILCREKCPGLRKGFNSHYRYRRRRDMSGKTITEPKPEKNEWADLHDALQYLVLGIFGRHGVVEGAPGQGREASAGGEDDGRSMSPGSNFDVFSI